MCPFFQSLAIKHCSIDKSLEQSDEKTLRNRFFCELAAIYYIICFERIEVRKTSIPIFEMTVRQMVQGRDARYPGHVLDTICPRQPAIGLTLSDPRFPSRGDLCKTQGIPNTTLCSFLNERLQKASGTVITARGFCSVSIILR